MKYIHLAMLFIMLAFAALQWNDPDAAAWIAIYVCCAILGIIAYTDTCIPCTVAWAILVLLFSIYLFARISDGVYQIFNQRSFSEILDPMQDTKLYIEETREALGLMIIWIYILTTLLSVFLRYRSCSDVHNQSS